MGTHDAVFLVAADNRRFDGGPGVPDRGLRRPGQECPLCVKQGSSRTSDGRQCRMSWGFKPFNKRGPHLRSRALHRGVLEGWPRVVCCGPSFGDAAQKAASSGMRSILGVGYPRPLFGILLNGTSLSNPLDNRRAGRGPALGQMMLRRISSVPAGNLNGSPATGNTTGPGRRPGRPRRFSGSVEAWPLGALQIIGMHRDVLQHTKTPPPACPMEFPVRSSPLDKSRDSPVAVFISGPEFFTAQGWRWVLENAVARSVGIPPKPVPPFHQMAAGIRNISKKPVGQAASQTDRTRSFIKVLSETFPAVTDGAGGPLMGPGIGRKSERKPALKSAFR